MFISLNVSVSVYVSLHVCMPECVSLPTLLGNVTFTHLNHTHPHRDQLHILCTSKTMTNLAGPPRIKKSYDLEHCEAVVVLLMRSLSSRLLFLQNE